MSRSYHDPKIIGCSFAYEICCVLKRTINLCVVVVSFDSVTNIS